jgi:hypothetical protein
MSFVGRLGLGRVNAYGSRLIGSRSPQSLSSFISKHAHISASADKSAQPHSSQSSWTRKQKKQSRQMLLCAAFTIAFRVSGGLGITIVDNALRNPQWLFIH